MSISKHERTKDGKEEWLTPPYILEALGLFDLDPCAPIVRPWDTAKEHYTVDDDGLSKTWSGRVWCNPPYGRKTPPWMARMALHNNGVALIYARTETNYWFPHVWDYAAAVFFFHGRLIFHNVDGTPATNKKSGKPEVAPAPSALIAYGRANAIALSESGLKGKCISLK